MLVGAKSWHANDDVWYSFLSEAAEASKPTSPQEKKHVISERSG